MKENLRTDTYRTEVYKYFLYSDIYKIGVNCRMVHLPKVNCESARHVREESKRSRETSNTNRRRDSLEPLLHSISINACYSFYYFHEIYQSVPSGNAQLSENYHPKPIKIFKMNPQQNGRPPPSLTGDKRPAL